jgi:hypothetical protein
MMNKGWSVCSFVFFFVVFIVLFAQSLGTRSQGTAATDILGIRIHDERQVGSYELAVLEAESSQALDGWLEDNGFTGLSEEDEKIVSDYIQAQWCLVAAKLCRQGNGYSRPHPLSRSFPSDKLVYPMRLTSTVGSNVYLELYVIADEHATCDMLTLEVSDSYRFRKERKVSFSGRIVPSDFAGKTHRQNIGHTDVAKFMSDGCVVSKLCGKLKPKQMCEDIVLQLKTGEPLKPEDSRGDYTIIEDERGIVWRTYPQGGYPDDYIVKPFRGD